MRNAGAHALLACSPAASRAIASADRSWVSAKDIRFVKPLRHDQAQRLADRAPEWAPALIERLDSRWRLWPFLLELILHCAELDPGLRERPPELTRKAIRVAATTQHFYVPAVFHNGLSAPHRHALRRAAGWIAAEINRVRRSCRRAAR
jgi:hypothetical protein